MLESIPVANLRIAAARKALLYGREFIVAPVTMLVPGVLHGSNGPLFYPAEEVAKNCDAWDHVPITLGHPSQNGQPVSARNPAILDSQGLGFVLATRNVGKLVAEAWFDVEQVRRISPETFMRLQAGRPIEVSTGLYTDNEPAEGYYNGREYKYIARNYRPDHLAVLLDQKGACSLSDGCGVLVNHRKETDMSEDLEMYPYQRNVRSSTHNGGVTRVRWTDSVSGSETRVHDPAAIKCLRRAAKLAANADQEMAADRSGLAEVDFSSGERATLNAEVARRCLGMTSNNDAELSPYGRMPWG